MADVRPLPGLRYTATDDLAARVTPPYDVISPEAQTRYYERHPENIIRLELGRETPGDNELDDRYTRAAVTFAEWRLQGVLAQDAPAFYLYEQRFTAGGATHTRFSLLARVRLEPWDAGVVLPHERTLSKPKDDRLKLLRASAANLSPIMALYDDAEHALGKRLARARKDPPKIEFTDEAGEQHRLWPTTDALLAARVSAFFSSRQIYIADGHHRYETALAYRDEVRELRREIFPDDAVNFVLMALTAVEDPGLVVLPTHRIVRAGAVPPERLAALDMALGTWFDQEPAPGGDGVEGCVAQLEEAGHADGGTTALALIRPEGTTVLRLRPAGREAMRAAATLPGAEDDGDGEAHTDAWRALDVAVLHELVLRRALGIGTAAVGAGEHITYTRDPAAAVAAVREGEAALAFLLNPTPPAAIRNVALAGDRMPQKSTYFYPKLITGLVINPLW
ncbi:MAG: DUF1015 domain-containing protein [Ktedonobacterales bacterium]